MREEDLKTRKYPGTATTVFHLDMQIESLRNAAGLPYSAVEAVRLLTKKDAKPARRGLAGEVCEDYLRDRVIPEDQLTSEMSSGGNVPIPRLRPFAIYFYK